MRVGNGDFARVGGNRDGRFTSLRFYIRTRGDPGSQAGPARTAVSAVDKQQPVFSVRTMEEKLSLEGSPRRAMAIMVGVFAFVALLLATVGTYGVMAYSVSERTPEIGIRMALGAQRWDTVALLLKHGIRLLLIGLPLGLGGAFALSRILESQLFGVSASDPMTLVGVSLILAGVAISACYIPARRAAKVDPMVALRYE
jgi:putative ABC transport system permease protein